MGKIALAAAAVVVAAVAGFLLLRQPDPVVSTPAPVASLPAAPAAAVETAPAATADPAPAAAVVPAPAATVDTASAVTADPAPAAAAETANSALSAAAPAPAATPPQAVTLPAPPAAELAAPRLDVLRVDAQGNATFAGRAASGDQVWLLLDEVRIAETVADGSGSFAVLTRLDPSALPRILSVVARGSDGIARRGETDAIIAPFAGPQVAAMPETAGAAVSQAAPVQDAPSAPDPVAKAAAVAAVDGASTETEKADAQAQAAATTADAKTTPPAPPAILLAGPEGVEVAQSPGQAAQAVVLDAISYTATGAVQLAGRGPGDGFLRVYLDNRAIATTRISAEGRWRSDLPDIAAGLYTLRVDHVGDAGQVISRIETPFRREAPAQLAAIGAAASASATAPPPAAAAPAPVVSGADAASPAAGAAASSGTTPPVTAIVPADRDAAPAPPAGRVTAVTVQPGSTLWAIARDRYGSGALYVRLYEANKTAIRDPDLIYPGQVFALPD